MKAGMKAGMKTVLAALGYSVKRVGPNAYDQDGLLTYHTHDFVYCSKFMRSYALAKSKTARESHYGPWRVHIALWAGETALRREGDFVECGVFHAFMSVCILDHVNWNTNAGDRRFYLVDSFNGLVPELLTEREKRDRLLERFGDRYRDTFDVAKRNVDHYKNVDVVKGIVPDVLPSIRANRIAFLHIDMNSARPEVAALKFFWPKVVRGGVVLLDDYAYCGHRNEKEAMDETAKELGFTIASLPTGQGLIVK